MNFIKKIERYQKIDSLIRQECTGSLEEFAIKLKVNRSHLYRLLDHMKDCGASIMYNRKLLSFCYNKPFNLHSISPFKELSINDMEFTRGGVSIFSSVSFYETEGVYF